MKKNSFTQRIKSAFTLAEVLITLAIIGLVTAICLPLMIENIEDKIMADQVRMAKYKFTKATELMVLQNMMNNYATTEKFVDNLVNYYKVIKRCETAKVRDCWDYDSILLPDGTEYAISSLASKTGQATMMLNPTASGTQNFANLVGIVSVDGVHSIISYNTKCKLKAKVYTWTLDSSKRPITNDTSSCVIGLFDIDGDKIPNTMTEDVFLFNGEKLGTYVNLDNSNSIFNLTDDGYYQIPGQTWSFQAPFASSAIDSKAQYESLADSLGLTQISTVTTDYWAGAVQKCGGVSKTLTPAHVAMIMDRIIAKRPTSGLTKDYVSGILGSAAGNIYSALKFWTSSETTGDSATMYSFSNTTPTSATSSSTSRSTAGVLGICYGKTSS